MVKYKNDQEEIKLKTLAKLQDHQN